MTEAYADFLTDPQNHALHAICDTFVPSLEAADDPNRFYSLDADDVELAGQVAATFAHLPDEENQQAAKLLLTLFENRLFNLLTTGHFARFSELPRQVREQYLLDMARSKLVLRRQGFQALKRLSLFNFYTGTTGHGNPAWRGIGYPGPLVPSTCAPRGITPWVVPPGQEQIDCDVVIVGSGAGGGVVAAELAAGGRDVIVLEKGGYYEGADLNGREGEMIQELYLDGGLTTSRDQDLTVLAGRCLGGGTVVNWTTSFRTPERVRLEWADRFGLPPFKTDEFTHSLDAVCDRLGVNLEHNRCSPRDEFLVRGLQALGWHWDYMPRNVRGCTQDDQCGYCGFGCALGAKQSTTRTYLEDAFHGGGRIIVHATADRILLQHSQATGVHAALTDPATGALRRLTVRAKVVVLAAGAIHTPALLLKSGAENPALGRNFVIHPVAGIWGLTHEPIRMWTGTLQAVYSDQLADLHDGYGVKFETGPVHPGLFAMSTPWLSGQQHKELMAQYPSATVVGILLRDRDGGRVSINKRGKPVINYRLSAFDRGHLRSGIEGAAQILVAAGAQEIFDGQPNGPRIRPGQGETVQDLMAQVDAGGYGPHQMPLLTFHLMGTCRMGSDARQAAVDEHNEFHGLKNLFVADGSAFPGASGVNPMITIMAIAHRAAQYIKACN